MPRESYTPDDILEFESPAKSMLEMHLISLLSLFISSSCFGSFLMPD